MAYWYPRCHVHARVPVMGTTSERYGQSTERTLIDFDFNVIKAQVTKNDFNQADEATIDINYNQAPFDPRLLSNLILYVYMANAPGTAKWQPLPSDLRFVGVGSMIERTLDDEKKTVSVKALDYTTLFLAMKPYPQATGTPKFSQTLRQAWATICDHVGFYDFTTSEGKLTSSVTDLRTNIKGIPDDSVLDRTIGESVLSRIAKFGQVQIPHEADGWAAWHACVDPLGLLTWIDADTCFVARAPDYYSGKNPAVFQYGSNVRMVNESRDISSLNGKGIHTTAFDPLTGKTIESFFPRRDDPRVVKKRLSASKKQGSPGLAPVTDYEHQTYPYHCTQESLDDVAQRVWEERSRQELEGRLSTSKMTVKAKDGKTDIDILSLKHGDQIAVQLDQLALDEMRKLPTTFARSYYLLQRGFSPSVAALIASDQGYLQNLLATFVVKEVTIDYDASAEHFETEVSFCSRINPNTGSTDDSTTQETNRRAILDQLESSES